MRFQQEFEGQKMSVLAKTDNVCSSVRSRGSLYNNGLSDCGKCNGSPSRSCCVLEILQTATTRRGLVEYWLGESYISCCRLAAWYRLPAGHEAQ